MITCNFENGDVGHFRHVTTSIIVIENKQILLVKRSVKSIAEPNKWALPGGYLDMNETIVEGALRELKEETGYQGKNPKLFQIIDKPIRPHEDKQNVEFTFIIKVDKKVGVHDQEVSDIKWFPFNKLPPVDELAFDHYETIKLYLKK